MIKAEIVLMMAKPQTLEALLEEVENRKWMVCGPHCAKDMEPNR